MIKNLFTLFVLLVGFLSYSQDVKNDCESLKTGSFIIYENDKSVGTIFRKKNYQIEKYSNEEKYVTAKLKERDCIFYIRNYNPVSGLDTITMAVTYYKINKLKSFFVAKPAYLDINYKYEGFIKKVSSDIKDVKALKIFKDLNNE